MAINKALEIAVILTAIDRMSSVVNSAVNNATGKLQQMRMQFRDGAAMIGGGQEIANVVAGPIKTFAQYEKSAAYLKANMMGPGGFLNQAQWVKVNDLAVKLGNELPGNTADFYQMFNRMKQLGMSVETILGGAGRAAALYSVATGESYDNVADKISKIKNAIQIADEDSVSFMDTMSRVNNIGVNIDEMTMALGRSSGALQFLGIKGKENFTKIAAIFSVFMKGGTGAYTTGTNFGRLTTNMLNPEKYKQLQEGAKKNGLDGLFFLDKKGNFAGLDNMMVQFNKMKGMSTKAVSDILKPLTGLEGLDDQMAKIFSNGGFDKYIQNLKDMGSQGSLLDKVAMLLSTLDAKWEQFTGTIDNIKAAIGSSILTPLQKLANFINKVAVALQEFSSTPFGKAISAIAMSLLSVLSAGLMLAGLIKIINGIKLAFASLTVIMELNPFVLIATALIAAAVLIYTYWDEIKAFFVKLWNWIKGIFMKFWGWVKPYIMTFTPIGWLIQLWDPISKFFVAIWNYIKGIFVGAFKVIKYIILNFTPLGFIIKKWAPIKEWFVWFFGKLFAPFVDLWNKIKQFGPKIWGAVSDIWKRIIANIKDFIAEITEKINQVTDAIEHPFKFLKGKSSFNASVNNTVSGLSGGSVPALAQSNNSNAYTFSPNVYLPAGAVPADGSKFMDTMKPHMDAWWNEKERNKQRKAF